MTIPELIQSAMLHLHKHKYLGVFIRRLVGVPFQDVAIPDLSANGIFHSLNIWKKILKYNLFALWLTKYRKVIIHVFTASILLCHHSNVILREISILLTDNKVATNLINDKCLERFRRQVANAIGNLNMNLLNVYL